MHKCKAPYCNSDLYSNSPARSPHRKLKGSASVGKIAKVDQLNHAMDPELWKLDQRRKSQREHKTSM